MLKPVLYPLIPLAAIGLLFAARSSAVDPAIAADEKVRIAVIAKVKPAVAAVCGYGGTANGSGVIIDPEGYALTNFHVTEGVSPVMQSGLADGELYETVLVGLDKIGDVALVKLVPKVEGKPFPYVKLGDSDAVRVGDWSLAMGNPFGLSTDFNPTVTYGVVSGVNRYQPPGGGGILEYTDCIQVETSINPGNSGGPLFNMNGELIGINGRGSFDKRGRVNSGVGYAISINQIKNFLGHFYAGIDTDHATLGATVQTKTDDGSLGLMTVNQVLADSDAFRRGLKPDDEIVSFAGRQLTSTNQYKNILGIFPKDWRLPLAFRRDNKKVEVLVRLMGNMDTPVEEKADPKAPKPPAEKPDPAQARAKKSPAMKLFKEKKGFANYYFNEIQQKKLWDAFVKHGDFTGLGGAWSVNGTFDANERKGAFLLNIADDTAGETEAKLKLNVDYALKPLKADNQVGERLVPDGSGGLLAALYQYRRLLTEGAKGFESGFTHAGTEPVYPPGAADDDFEKRRVLCNVLRTKHAAVECKWFFEPKENKLIACEVSSVEGEDPCEVYFSEYKAVDGRQLPHRLDVRWGDKKYGYLAVTGWGLGKK